MSERTLVGGRVLDPASGRDVMANVVVADGVVRAVGDDVVGERIDVAGCVIVPGFVDPHVHLREPGAEDSETIASGAEAAAAGGYTAVFAMANTDPTPDAPERIAALRARASSAACQVEPVGAITMGLAGEKPVDMRALAGEGVRYVSDDGLPVASAAVMRAALREASACAIVIGNHSEEPSLTAGAQANEGPVAEALGLAGWPHEAEEVMIARDVLLAEGLGACLHVPHVSTAAAVDVIRWAKQRGARVTAEATPHHLTLVDESVRTGDTAYKVNPPLRRDADVRALRDGLADGTIDMVATDHAPHAPARKDRAWEHAPCGMLGLETAFAVLHTRLVVEGGLPLRRLVDALATRPARVFGLESHGGPIAPGRPANLAVIDPDQRWVVDPERMRSLSRNSPFAGMPVQGRVVHTLYGGALTLKDGALVDRGAS